jgi:hypothetical protein
MDSFKNTQGILELIDNLNIKYNAKPIDLITSVRPINMSNIINNLFPDGVIKSEFKETGRRTNKYLILTGGSNSKQNQYYNKYLKYKAKYTKLKTELKTQGLI